MPLVGFEPAIPVFERAKTFHALDHTAIGIGLRPYYERKYYERTDNTISTKWDE
jgi:hypothetical protein